MLKKSAKEPTDAVAETRAAQILAEMLGVVCHPEYFESDQEQTVLPIPLSLCIADTPEHYSPF